MITITKKGESRMILFNVGIGVVIIDWLEIERDSA
jgi:hypothetical protein